MNNSLTAGQAPGRGYAALSNFIAGAVAELAEDLAYLGGWKDAKMLLECYQQPDEERARAALAARRPFRPAEPSSTAGATAIQPITTSILAKRPG